jgi:copper chaperone NosL
MTLGRPLHVCGLAVAVLLFLSACEPKPRPLEYGTDTCHSCKMTLADKRFGAELVTKKGKIYAFDDINCMLSFYNSPEFDQAELAHNLVVDYENPGQFLIAGQTFFVKSEAIKSPMASKVAAFENYERAILFKNAKGGILLGWAEVTTQFK